MSFDTGQYRLVINCQTGPGVIEYFAGPKIPVIPILLKCMLSPTTRSNLSNFLPVLHVSLLLLQMEGITLQYVF
jgi:hypothetical protein